MTVKLLDSDTSTYKVDIAENSHDMIIFSGWRKDGKHACIIPFTILSLVYLADASSMSLEK